MKLRLSLALLLLFIMTPVLAQEAIPARPSPLAVVTMKYGQTYVKITYSQPHKRGREIFGELVPFGKIWRTGANEATEITATQEIMFGEYKLEAGTYSIFTIPEDDHWTVIINDRVGQWGAYNYNPAYDVLRIKVPVQSINKVIYEPFTMMFDQQNDIANLLMMWDQTKITIPIKFIAKE